jgi:hypothetical protein
MVEERVVLSSDPDRPLTNIDIVGQSSLLSLCALHGRSGVTHGRLCLRSSVFMVLGLFVSFASFFLSHLSLPPLEPASQLTRQPPLSRTRSPRWI